MTDPREDEINLLDYLIVLLKRKKLILGLTFGFAFVAAIVSLVIPPTFRAETRILPPKAGPSAYAELLGQFGGAALLAGGSLGIKNPNDVYIGMLKSRTIYDRIIDRFGLMELYDLEYREDARKKLDESVNVTSGSDEMLVVAVEDGDPSRAAEMANAFVDELKALTQTLAVTEASKRRLFFEEQLLQIKEELISAEDSMRAFQESTGAVKMEEQAESVIQSIAELRAQIASKEVELKVMRTYSTPSNPDLQLVREQLEGMKEQLARIESKGGSGPDPMVPAGSIPEIGTDYMRKLRDLKYYETLFELMAKQYEMARIDEARDATIIQVLDRAVPPEKKARPKRKFIVMTAAFSGFFLAAFAAFLLEFTERLSNDGDGKEKLRMLRKYARIGKGPVP